jgi:hypothetical protein
MRIGVEEAVDQDHLQERLHAASGEELAIETRRVHRGRIGGGHAFHVLLHQQ